MSFRISWGPEAEFVTIVTKSAEDAFRLASEYEAMGQPPIVSLDDGTMISAFELEVMASASEAYAAYH